MGPTYGTPAPVGRGHAPDVLFGNHAPDANQAFARHTGIPYTTSVRTVIETPTFQRQAAKLWSEDQRLDFIQWLATHPEAGDVIPGADGVRKVRWTLAGSGKRVRRKRHRSSRDDVREERARERGFRRHPEGRVK